MKWKGISMSIMRNLFNILNFKRKQGLMNENEYYGYLINSNDNNLYGFDKRFSNQEDYLYKLYGKCDEYNKKVRMIVISDTHNCLKEEEFRQFIECHNIYDICILLGDHNSNDISILLKYIDKNKIYGLLGNHDYDYLLDYGIPNLNGRVIDVNGTTLLGIEGSFKYKPSNFPSFSQKESILFFDDKPKVDILLSHDNRFDSSMERNPAHQGLFEITYYLFKNKVPYHIHGHIHNPYKKDMINGTKEISVYMFEYLEL